MDQMEQIYLDHAKTVYGFLLSRTHDANLAEELTQETFFQAVKSIDRFEGNCNISTWLCAIAKNLWRQHLRKEEKTDIITTTEDLLQQLPAESDSLPFWDDVRVLRAIHHLGESMREVMYLRLSSNLSFRQIGEIMGKSENWARVTYYRGKEKIIEEVRP